MVDDQIPCIVLHNKKPVPVFTRAIEDNEFWPSLIEKAYAKLHGSYERLETLSLRETISDFTGLEPEII